MPNITEGLIAVPPKMEEHINFILTFHILWWARDRFKGKIKELPNQYAAFKKMVAQFGEQLPLEKYNIQEGISVTNIPVDMTGMPKNYKSPKINAIRFAIVWRPEKNAHGTWWTKKNALVVFPLSLDYLAKYPSPRSDPDDLKIALDTLKETIRHELRHMVQYLMIDHPEQTKIKTDYQKHENDYYTSPVEFDPTIGSAVQEFINIWNLYGESSRKIPLDKAIKRFVGAIQSDSFSPFATNSFFKILKKTAPQQYKTAIKKFVHEVAAKVHEK